MAVDMLGFRYARRCPRGFVPFLLFVSALLGLYATVYSSGALTATITQFSGPSSKKQPSSEFSDYDQRTYHPPQDIVLPLPVPDNAVSSEARIGKLSMVFPGPAPIYTRAIQSHEPHNRIHGYPMMVLRHSMLEGGTVDGLWNKPAYILAILLEEMRKEPSKRLDWLCWFDADTVLLNPNIPLSLFLPPRSLPNATDIHVLLTRDRYGPNNGVFLMRVSPVSVMLFAAIMAYRSYFPSKDLAWEDQSAMIEFLNERDEFRNKWRYVPQRWFNAYAGYAGFGNATEPEVVLADEGDKHPDHLVRRGDLLVHFPGWYAEARNKMMQQYMDSVQENDAWAVDLSSLPLKAEVDDYWEKESHAHEAKG